MNFNLYHIITGAELNSVSAEEHTALDIAISKMFPKVVELLKAAGNLGILLSP